MENLALIVLTRKGIGIQKLPNKRAKHMAESYSYRAYEHHYVGHLAALAKAQTSKFLITYSLLAVEFEGGSELRIFLLNSDIVFSKPKKPNVLHAPTQCLRIFGICSFS